MTAIFLESPQDWISSSPSKVYYNSRSKKYTATIVTKETLIPEDMLSEAAQDYYEDFVISVLKNLNKKEDLAPTLVNNVEILGNYIDPSPFIKEKILLAIPATALEEIPEKEELDVSGEITSVCSLNSFFKKIDNVASKFRDYEQQYISNIYQNSSNPYSNVDFTMEAEALLATKSNFNELLSSNDVDMTLYDNIEISRTEEFNIVKIVLSRGADNLSMKYLFENFSTSYPQNREQTNVFICQISQLNADIISNNQDYQTIVDKYFLNGRTKRESSSNILARSSSKSMAAASTNKDETKSFAAAKEISKRSAKILQREILNSVYRTPCMTPEERDRINRKLEREKEKKANFANKLSISVGDAFFRNLPQVLQQVADKQGDEALKSLGRNVLNRLGVCGIGDLTSLVTNTVFAYINEQEYADELSKCATQNLDNSKVSKVWEEIERFGKNAEIVERYRKVVGDTIPPWTTGGYTPPDYYKDLDTDDAISAQYTLKIGTPLESTDIEFRFAAFKNAIAGVIKGEDLLNVLVNTFPDDMGWLNFFTDMTKGILNKCKVPSPNVGVSFTANWCQKRVNLPEFEDVPKSNASFAFRPSMITTILVEELKNIIINLTIRVVVSTMRQIFEIISAAASVDSDYFAQNQYIPDLFQNENDLQNQMVEFCKETSSSYQKVNSTVRDVFEDMYPSTAAFTALSLEEVDSFLKKCSVGLGKYEKVSLYNGDGAPATYEKVLSLNSETPIGQYLQNYADVEALFLRLGELVDVRAIEDDLYNYIQSPPLSTIGYCGDDFDYLRQGYLVNKANITEDQISKMKNTLKDIQKNKVCFAVDTLGNANGAIIGQLGEMLKSKSGPLFTRIAEETGKLFEPVIENQLRVVSKNYQNDLYNSRGLFDLIMVNMNGIGKNRRQLALFFNPSVEDDTTVRALANSKIEGSSYSPSRSSANLNLSFVNDATLSYKSADDIISIQGPESDLVLSGLRGTTSPGLFESSANGVYALLIQNQDILRENLNDRVARNFIQNGILKDTVESYQLDLQEKLLAPPRTYINKWGMIYNAVQQEENEYIPLILGEKSLIDKTKSLYGLLSPITIESKYVPFNVIKSKEEAALLYSAATMLTRVISSEIFLKSLPVYEAFGANLFQDFNILGEYIYRRFNSAIDDFSNDKRRLKVLEKITQLVILLSNNDMLPPLPSEVVKSVDNINKNIVSWVKSPTSKRVDNLESNEDDMEKVVKFFVTSVSKEYIKEFQKAMSKVEDNTFPSINRTNTLYNYIFKNSILDSATDVVADVTASGPLSAGLRLERYINLKNPKSKLLSGVQNLEEFKDYLMKSPLSGNITDHWESWSFGMRIAVVSNPETMDITKSQIGLAERDFLKAFYLQEDSTNKDANNFFLSPVVVYEKEIPNGEINSAIIDSYDDSSMAQALSESRDFVDFYYPGMNIENLLSLTTIYINEEFGNFLSNLAPDPVILPSTVTRWQSSGEKLFNDTKRYIVNTLEKI